MHRARHSLMGKKFLLDHQPLEFLFHPRQELPKVTSARLLRWAICLVAFDYDIQYVKGESIPHIDALLRLDFSEDHGSMAEDAHPNGEESFMHWVDTDVVSKEELRPETKRDRLLAGILDRISSNCSVAECPFTVCQSFTCDFGVLYKGDLLVPPATLRERILKAVHSDVHEGTTTIWNRLKLEAWWPGYCDAVERMVKQCSICQSLRSVRPRHTHIWPEEQEPWSRVHMDHRHVLGVGP